VYPRLRPWLFRLDPESAHTLTISLLRLAGRLPVLQDALRRLFPLPASSLVPAFGLSFANPLGLAAGYDKDGLAWRGLACLGFGHIEIGTVTPRPQPGNPRPRIFRLVADQALINRMGFPGRGSGFVLRHLSGPRPPGLVLGVNLGKNKDTPLEDSAQDYLALLATFAPLADYLAVNVSSPNTIGLRRLQSRQMLSGLLSALAQERRTQEQRLARRLPLLVKLSPDLSEPELDDALQVILDHGLDGVIAANTTLSRPGLLSPLVQEAGGLSGAPLEALSTRLVHLIRQRTAGSLPVIAAGGVMSAAAARRKLDAGACLVQIYTGLVYHGPALVQQILAGIAN
jgi:dihydroorotate dehydrogenase